MSNAHRVACGEESWSERTGQPLCELFDALAAGRRRHVVSILAGHGPVTEHDLATHVVARERGVALLEVTEADHQQASISLYHVHLPKLTAAGLVERDGDGEIALSDPRLVRHPAVAAVLERHGSSPTDDLDDLLSALADPRRRRLLGILRGRETPLSPRDLAEALAEEREETDPRGRADAESILIDLGHVQLPALAEAGLVAFDGHGEPVAFEGHPALDEALLAIE